MHAKLNTQTYFEKFFLCGKLWMVTDVILHPYNVLISVLFL